MVDNDIRGLWTFFFFLRSKGLESVVSFKKCYLERNRRNRGKERERHTERQRQRQGKANMSWKDRWL
jgi:hypothetical protein